MAAGLLVSIRWRPRLVARLVTYSILKRPKHNSSRRGGGGLIPQNPQLRASFFMEFVLVPVLPTLIGKTLTKKLLTRCIWGSYKDDQSVSQF